jgi:hypothetical protein
MFGINLLFIYLPITGSDGRNSDRPESQSTVALIEREGREG